MTWHLFWLAAISFIFILAIVIYRLSIKDEHGIIPAKEVEKIEQERRHFF